MEIITTLLFPIQLIIFGIFLINVAKFIYLTIKTKLS